MKKTPSEKTLSGKSIAIIGGCGHVGLPLGVKFALAGARTTLVDIDSRAVDRVNSGNFPFVERGGDEQLKEALGKGLSATTDPGTCKECDVVVFVTGTPVDEHLNPKISDVLRIFDAYKRHFRPGTLVIMRSTLFPGTMEHLYNRVQESKTNVHLAFCPERVAQGVALDEIDNLPQIVSAFDDASFEAAYSVFGALAPEIIRLTPLEAEMTKLMANSWRYLEFAIANQFYMIAESNGVDFQRIYQAIRYKYPRAGGYKSPGLSAGPCLFKDTMQLASFFDHQFSMGHSAMLVNEGLASFMVTKAAQLIAGAEGAPNAPAAKPKGSGEGRNEMWGRTVGILGLSFKADNDDIRESLSFRVKKACEFRGAKTLCHDPYLPEMSVPMEKLLSECEVVILCTPHGEYKSLKLKQPVVDVWAFFGKPELEILPGTNAV